jgi:hypothetical protein
MADGDLKSVRVDCNQGSAGIVDQSIAGTVDLMHNGISHQMAARYVRSPPPLPDSLNNGIMFRYRKRLPYSSTNYTVRLPAWLYTSFTAGCRPATAYLRMSGTFHPDTSETKVTDRNEGGWRAERESEIQIAT